ncbi:MAG: phosphoenolpyruvate carboxykinase (ATP) [Dehalococcoidia bacterium]|jgi:phosphoenolpyruvate carboxykinase (ATP)|nr:phosphoenolpyruvate carboxykinase (ATP) [Dehalococcoidia bacterium]
MVLDLREFERTADRIRAKAKAEGRLTDNPDARQLRAILAREPGARQTRYGNFAVESEPTSRSAIFTKNSVDNAFGDDERRLLAECEEKLSHQRLISLDRVVGDENSGKTVRLIVPERFAHVAYGGGNLFVPCEHPVDNPTYQIVFFYDDAFDRNRDLPLAQKDITIRLAMLEDGHFVKVVRNGNYIGEYKKGVFAAEDWTAKAHGDGIFLHAGCREDHLQSAHGEYRTVRTMLVALSANGKTSTTCKILARKGNEKSWLVQDDGGTLMADGSFHGYEAGGVFVKTEGVNPGTQAEIYYGLLKPSTLCENVYVSDDGDFDFYNFQRTSNGRAVVRRADFMHASNSIDVEHIDNFVLITRGPLIPAISRLTREQAAALMVLGQAMESSAGNPALAGTIRSEFFYDPFVAGDRAAHANRFYEIQKCLPEMNYYLLNTSGIGSVVRNGGDPDEPADSRYRNIRLEDTMAILDSLLRGGLENWVESPTGFLVPGSVRALDDIYFHPEKLFSATEFEDNQAALNRVRREAIETVGPGLDRAIRTVFDVRS